MKPTSAIRFVLACVLSVAMSIATAAVITVDFDGVAPASGAPVHAYLAGYGITFSGAGVTPAIQASGVHITAPSAPNYFSGHFPAFAYSYTMTFATPLLSFELDTVSISNVSTMAAWSATAFTAANTIISSIGNPAVTGPGTPSAHYVLAGPNIDHIVFFTDVQGFAGNEFKFDNLVLTTAAAPEPHALALMLAGLGLLGFVKARARR